MGLIIQREAASTEVGAEENRRDAMSAEKVSAGLSLHSSLQPYFPDSAGGALEAGAGVVGAGAPAPSTDLLLALGGRKRSNFPGNPPSPSSRMTTTLKYKPHGPFFSPTAPPRSRS